MYADGDLVNEILRVVARVRADNARGSATIIHSSPAGTYALTNYHVIECNVEYKQVWDELLQRKVEKEFARPVEIDIPRVADDGRLEGLITSQADIVLCNQQQDTALLRLRDSERYPTARLYPIEQARKIPILAPLAACGAALGQHNVVTFGHLNAIQCQIDNYEYWLSSANVVFGHSGGGIFTPYAPPKSNKPHWHYCGIPARVTVKAVGFSVDVIHWLAYFIPIFRIYDWLRANCYEFLWDSRVSKKDCDRRREELRQVELAGLLSKIAKTGEE